MKISVKKYVTGDSLELQKIATRFLDYIENNFVLQTYYRTTLFLNSQYKQSKRLVKEEDRQATKEYLETLSMQMSSMTTDLDEDIDTVFNEMYEKMSCCYK